VPQDDAADDVQTDLAPVREKIRELREARGWTQEKLAELSGLGPDTIVRIERGRTGTPPKRSTLILLSLIFGRERDYLVNIMKHVPQREDDNPTLQSVSNVLAEFRGTLGSIKEDVKQQRDILYQIAPAGGQLGVAPFRFRMVLCAGSRHWRRPSRRPPQRGWVPRAARSGWTSSLAENAKCCG
jgi:transcriptional regulator with XRE-family HTH domain